MSEDLTNPTNIPNENPTLAGGAASIGDATPAAPTESLQALTGKPFAVLGDNGEAVPAAAPITTLQLQPEDPEDGKRAEQARARMEQSLSEKTQNEMAAGAKTIGADGQPALTRVQAEMQAGRERLAFHAGRQAMLDAKRSEVSPEAGRVADATKANKDL